MPLVHKRIPLHKGRVELNISIFIIKKNKKNTCILVNYMIVYYSLSDKNCLARWLHGQAVKTSPFHGGNTGSNPVGVIFSTAMR